MDEQIFSDYSLFLQKKDFEIISNRQVFGRSLSLIGYSSDL